MFKLIAKNLRKHSVIYFEGKENFSIVDLQVSEYYVDSWKELNTLTELENISQPRPIRESFAGDYFGKIVAYYFNPAPVSCFDFVNYFQRRNNRFCGVLFNYASEKKKDSMISSQFILTLDNRDVYKENFSVSRGSWIVEGGDRGFLRPIMLNFSAFSRKDLCRVDHSLLDFAKTSLEFQESLAKLQSEMVKYKRLFRFVGGQFYLHKDFCIKASK